MPVERVSIRVPPAGPLLAGALHRPEAGAAPSGGVVVAHPHPLMGGDMESPVVRALADECSRRGLLALRFDFRHARAPADVDAGALVRDAVADLAAAMENVRARLPPGSRVALAGYSFGGLIALALAARVESPAVAVVGLPLKIEREVGEVAWGEVAKAGRDVLVLQGQYDEAGPPDAVRAFLSAKGVAADVRPVPNASHGYFGAEVQVARIAAGFLAKRLARPSL